MFNIEFGPGTKLIVRDPKIPITAPKVKVLPPSLQESCDQRKRRRKTPKVTLVCVATGFYPDHITVSWQLNGADVTKGFKTDDAALRDADDKFYSITSRLRVQSKQWFDTRNFFSCITSFYNGSGYLENKDTVRGVKGETQNGLVAVRRTYGLLLCKSVLYALLVSALLWKRKQEGEKEFTRASWAERPQSVPAEHQLA